MTDSYDLSKLGPDAFENIVNFLALKTLGMGSTGFGPGADGGRDGYFEGEAQYPSETERWKGVWYIQSKFHKPHLSTDPQKWLIAQVKLEIKAFDQEGSDRVWPDNWIIATNIDPSGKPETGSFDAIRKILKKSPGGKKVNLHIWGGRKILDLLSLYGDVARYYGHFLTPGHVISALYADLTESRASLEEIIRYFVVTQFSDNIFTKLDQAGSSSDVRPGVHDLFIDLPFTTFARAQSGSVLAELSSAAAQCHRYSLRNDFPESWRSWNKYSKRARVTLLKGGPGQGKSTVGQYLCQIHRACLILDSEGPSVIDAVKVNAKAICAAAQRNDFWPTSPRIAIQIELKEFAHWYSQRQSSQSNNVLTYLAETVAKKIGSKVLVKTLKNAISKRAWIVIFDGLDEVPNDFKDEVAKEVMYFLNDVLVEIDADVLAVCTSRPQGYSGQFAGLDGPVLELNLLDAETAMSCAKPLLKFGRNTEEYEKSIEILESAILSPNVKELMTTPLQSHIMAVVVRDGGRPPERRWQLFNGFYLVMKKRESLKNFQNPRIAKLLREEDRLLKSVHMRLGFVLHARAERSEGAQTVLSREEFRSLVQDVVTELDDHEIEQTVADVMEATTQRLVLVSTPENGEQVRFDIRQLQEFFAAEFLYAGVDSTELGHRIETIGGDAHWREVMHFLMSALIENQRTADVAVAVQVLRRLDEGDEASTNKLYHRRMAKAGLLASRLLMEGVLEQDQRDRQQIKPLLDPLGGIFDLDILLGLSQVTPAKSRKWLVQLLLDKVETSRPREYVGALFLLAWLLPDDQLASAQVLSTAFINAPLGSQEYLCRLWASVKTSHYHRRLIQKKDSNKILCQWVIDTVVVILNSPNLVLYSPYLVEQLLFLCKDQKAHFTASCKMQNIKEDVAEAIFQCILFEEETYAAKPSKKDKIDCGLLTAETYEENWVNGKIPKQLVNIDAKRFVVETDGVFRLMLTCLWFAKDHSASSLTEFIRLADHVGTEKVSKLPPPLLALVPIEGTHSKKPFSIDHLRDIDLTDDTWLATLAAEKKIHPSYTQISLKPFSLEMNDEHWRLFAATMPKFAIHFAINSGIGSQKVQPKFVPELITLIQDMPCEASCDFLKWGVFQESQPELLKSLKEKMCALSPLPLHKGLFWFEPHTELSPFELKLPEEVQLLSVLATVLVNYLKYNLSFEFASKVGVVSEEFSLQAVLTQYGLLTTQLRSIAESSCYNQTARAGALALYWMSRPVAEMRQADEFETKLNLVREMELYAELVNDINEEWLSLTLVRFVLIRNSETNAEALAFVTYLMERCLDGGGPRNALIELIENWRERSTAPVHSKKVLEKWLGYNFQAPAYAGQ